MTLSIFDLFFTMLGYAWELFAWVADMSLRFFGAALNFGMRAVGAVLDFMLTPFTRGVDWLLACGGLDLKGIFAVVMWVLLIACALLAVFAAGSNVYRKYLHKLK